MVKLLEILILAIFGPIMLVFGLLESIYYVTLRALMGGQCNHVYLPIPGNRVFCKKCRDIKQIDE
jgi:hypothetical protein